MRKNYQNQEIDTSRRGRARQVSVALAEIAGEMREGLLALAVGAGLQVMAAMMEADVTAAGGPKGTPRPRPDRDPPRPRARLGDPGRAPGAGSRPRMRAVDGSGELPVAGLRAVLRHRGAGPDGAGADAGRAVDPPLPGRAGAGRQPRSSRPRRATSQVGGVAPVRGHDRDRAGRAARRGPVRAGPGGADGRRGALRRAHLRGRPRHRHRRDQAPAGAGRGLDRERHPGHRAAGRAARARPGRHPPDPGACSTGPRRCAARSWTCSTAR